MPPSNDYSQAFKDIIRIVGRGRKLQRDLTTEEATQAMRLLLSAEISDAQIGAFLITMRVKEETVDEIIGFVQGVREIMQPFPRPQVDGLVDLALPYDGKEKHLQTSVCSALVIAAAGVPVLLHGLDNIPAKIGVAPLNLLRALGYPADLPPNAVSRNIETTRFGVLNLDHVLPEWTRLTPLRHHFGLRTLLNTVEKLINPADAPIHINGFYHGSYLTRLATALPGSQSNWIVQGEEGGVDIRPGKKTRVYQAQGDVMVETMINSADYGFDEVVPLEAPNDPEFHARELRRALNGEHGAIYDQIALTSATLLWMIGAAPDIHAGLETARNVLDDGAAIAILEKTQPVVSELQFQV
jgi:anthranilate phosphoribosyltransferase